MQFKIKIIIGLEEQFGVWHVCLNTVKFPAVSLANLARNVPALKPDLRGEKPESIRLTYSLTLSQ
jgi:hypothetical protein